MQTENSQTKSKRMMPETRSASEDFLPIIKVTPNPNVIQSFSLRRESNICKQSTSLLVSRVSCLSPGARENFPAPLKIGQMVSRRLENDLQCLCSAVFFFQNAYLYRNECKRLAFPYLTFSLSLHPKKLK